MMRRTTVTITKTMTKLASKGGIDEEGGMTMRNQNMITDLKLDVLVDEDRVRAPDIRERNTPTSKAHRIHSPTEVEAIQALPHDPRQSHLAPRGR
jgi:hypothetical protein